jgi:hypothetical protein
VIAGGLVAGLVMNVFDMINALVLMKDDFAAMAQRLNLDQAVVEGTGTMVTWIIVDFLFGLLLVFAYAAMRPRFGPGPKTAVVSGLTLYLAVTVVILGFTAMGIFTQDVFIKSTVISLVTTIVGSVAGAAVYKE